MNVMFSTGLKKTQVFFTLLYVLLMSSMFLFYMQNGFFDVTEAKLRCFIWLTSGYLGIQVVLLLAGWIKKVYTLHDFQNHVRRFSFCDWGMLMLLGSHVITTCSSPYLEASLFGSDGRGMGLVFSFLIAGMYFFVSRFLNRPHWALYGLLSGSAFVMVLGLGNGCGADPFHLFDGLNHEDVHRFLSTIGNVTFFADLLLMSLPIAVCLFHACLKPKVRLLLGGYIVLCFCGISISHVDGAYLGLAAFFIFYFFYTVHCASSLVRMLVLILLSLIGAKILQIGVYWGLPIYFDGISAWFMQGHIVDVGIIVIGGMLLGITYRKHKWDSLVLRRMRIVVAVVLLICLLGMLAMIVYFTCWNRDADIGVWAMYLRMDDAWGSMRGFLWRILISLYFFRFTVFQQLFGQGLDCTHVILAYANTDEQAVAFFDNAHNEYLQYLVTSGIVGLLAYACVLFSAIVRLLKNGKHQPEMAGIAGALIAHSAFALTGVNQPITTPLLFLLIAIGEAYLKKQSCRIPSPMETHS